jgi:hypothetical protein
MVHGEAERRVCAAIMSDHGEFLVTSDAISSTQSSAFARLDEPEWSSVSSGL